MIIAATGEDVFNLEVAGDHSYVANGIVVHNCDLLSTQNLYGLGPGVYPDRARTPWPAHPNTLSFIVIVFKDEVTDADRAGKETPIDALKRLTPEQQRGVLGLGKQEILAEGKLRQGMIRTPLGAVRKRIGVATPIRPKPAPPKPPQPLAHPRTLDDMIVAGKAKLDELMDKVAVTRMDAATRLPETLLYDLKQSRALGTAAKLSSGGRGAEMVRVASQIYPDDWTQRADKFGALTAKASRGRGYYMGRPGGEGEIVAGNFSVAVHEYTHRLQHAIPQLDDFFQELHHRRTAGEPIRRLRDIHPGRGYRTAEVAREDKYIDAYQGKVYSGSRMVYLGKHGALEVMSMAFQTLLGNEPEKLRRMLANDREMLNLTVGLLYRYVPKP